MADMMAGTHMHDPNSEWSQFIFWQNEELYPPQEPDYQFAAQLPQYQHSNYYDLPQDAQNVSYENHCQAARQSSWNNDSDNMDNGNGSRLTQMQMAELENAFIEVPKPKREFKKSLAEKMGLELPRVNHWFQNRRQKAKSQKHHGKQESDASSTGISSSGITQTLSMPTSETPISSEPSYHEHPLYSNGPVAYDLSMSPANDYPNLPNDVHGHVQSMEAPFQPAVNHDPLMSYKTESNTALTWATDLTHVSTDETFSSSAVNNRPMYSLSPPSHTDSRHAFTAGVEGTGEDLVNQPFLQNNVFGNALLDNNSSQTLNTNASSIRNPNSLLTPPNNTPPLPWLSQEFDPRRASDSSELANNVEGMHLQQRQPSFGEVNNTIKPVPSSSAPLFTGMATPDTSPEQSAIKSSVPRSDLASRRKRSRPATLRPETNRSISLAGSWTVSPHARQSSMSLAPPNTVRRIQSQGQNINTHFRVHKSIHNSAHISPRSLQTHLDKHSTPPIQRQSSSESNHASPTTIVSSSKQPSAHAASANKSPAEYQHEFHAFSPAAQWNSNIFQMPRHGNSSVPDLHSVSSRPQHSISVQVPSQHEVRHSPYHCPPQSAPPQQTTFFDHSPVSHHGPYQPPHWPEHHSSPTGAPAMSCTPTHQTPILMHNDGGYLPPFAPQFQFPQDGSPIGYPGPYYPPGLPPGAIVGPPAPPIELDIKVDVGPEPKLTSKFEKFEFQHTFSDKYGQNGEKK